MVVPRQATTTVFTSPLKPGNAIRGRSRGIMLMTTLMLLTTGTAVMLGWKILLVGDGGWTLFDPIVSSSTGNTESRTEEKAAAFTQVTWTILAVPYSGHDGGGYHHMVPVDETCLVFFPLSSSSSSSSPSTTTFSFWTSMMMSNQTSRPRPPSTLSPCAIRLLEPVNSTTWATALPWCFDDQEGRGLLKVMMMNSNWSSSSSMVDWQMCYPPFRVAFLKRLQQEEQQSSTGGDSSGGGVARQVPKMMSVFRNPIHRFIDLVYDHHQYQYHTYRSDSAVSSDLSEDRTMILSYLQQYPAQQEGLTNFLTGHYEETMSVLPVTSHMEGAASSSQPPPWSEMELIRRMNEAASVVQQSLDFVGLYEYWNDTLTLFCQEQPACPPPAWFPPLPRSEALDRKSKSMYPFNHAPTLQALNQAHRSDLVVYREASRAFCRQVERYQQDRSTSSDQKTKKSRASLSESVLEYCRPILRQLEQYASSNMKFSGVITAGGARKH